MHRDECLQLLAAEEVGRVAVMAHATPAIFPVNYVLDGEDIVFRTDPGTKLAAESRAIACFEIDQIDRRQHTGWSVTVTGRLEEITKYDRAWARVTALPVEPWAAGAKQHWLRLTGDRITGRRLGRVD
jgi:nitroimidazol reductase NimA-like FMN-containing flavoprotein (pyridoxamine 5'-phosphate oxidase superfamily)